MKGLSRLIIIILTLIFLSACDSGSSGESDAKNNNYYSNLIATAGEPSGSNCTYGGVKIMTGMDENGDGILQMSEVSSTEYICTPAPSDNAYSSLIATVSEPSGSNCTYGGVKITIGLDTNSNGVLDASEVSSTEYICSSRTDELVDGGYAATGRIYGNMAKRQTFFARIFSTQNNSDSELILIPDNVSLSVDADEDGKDSGGELPATITAPIYVNIADNGSYNIDDLPTGSYMLLFLDKATEQGYQIKVDVAPDGAVQVNRDETKEKPVRGRVTVNVRSGDTPLTGAVVKVLETSKTEVTSAGSAMLAKLVPGEYTIRVSMTGYVTVDVPYSTTDSDSVDVSLELIATAGSLSGKLITDDNITRYSNALVYVKSAGGTVRAALVNADGTWSLGEIPADMDYSIIGWAHDYTSTKADGVTVTAGQNTAVEDIVLSRIAPTTGSIAGFVRYADRTRMNHEGIIVAVEGTDFEAVTARDGSFVINNVPSGRYTLNALESSYQTTTMTGVRVVGGGAVNLTDIALNKRTGVIRGVAKLSGTNNHTGITITLAGTNYKTYTDSSGLWSISAPLGNYADGVVFSKQYYTSAMNQATITVTDAGAYNVAEVLLVQESAAISGRLSIAGITDCSGANIRIQISGSGSYTDITPAADCSYIIDELPFGEYALTVTYNDNLHEAWQGTVTVDDGGTFVNMPQITLRTGYIKINDDAVYTKSANVNLEIGSSSATMMLISGDVEQTPAWESYSKYRTVTLVAGDGEKTVNVSLKSDTENFGNVSSAITLDTTVNLGEFTAIGASKKGDTLLMKLNANETGGIAKVTVPGLFSGLVMNDLGINGDDTANDGIYSRSYHITTATEVSQPATVTFTDRAGNTATKTSAANVILSTPPAISAVTVSSSLALGEMTISFATDEPATAIVDYGADTAYGSSKTVSAGNRMAHEVYLTGLTTYTMTYFKLTATDSAGNTTEFTGSNKLAPPAPEGFTLTAGNTETGMVWKPSAGKVAGYNIYRKTDSGIFNKINNAPVTDTYYVDKTVVNGVQYEYRVASVDSDGNESNQSDAKQANPSTSLAGPTDIGLGIVDRDTVWLSSRGPYNVNAGHQVIEKVTLYVLPGTVVNLNDTLEVNGNLKVYGTAEQKVTIQGSGRISTYYGVGVAEYYYAEISSGLGAYNTQANWYGGHGTHRIYNSTLTGVMDNNVDCGDYSSGTCIDLIVDSTINGAQCQPGGYCYGGLVGVAANTADNIIAKDLYILVDNITNSKIIDGRMDSLALYYSGGSGYAENVEFDNMTVYHYKTIKSSVFKNNSQITFNTHGGSYQSHTDVSFSKFDLTSGAPGALTAGKNYWSTLDHVDIRKRVGNDTVVYPVITSDDLYIADFDKDGYPDYLDWDNDNDGWSDAQEWALSRPTIGFYYNPLDASDHPGEGIFDKDIDVDGIPDNVDTDNDNDGLSDILEGQIGTNPYIADTDGDGVNDGMEHNHGYDPLDKNSYPLTGIKTGLEITAAAPYLNNVGRVYVANTFSCTDCTVAPGVKLYIPNDARATFNTSTLAGTKNDPVYIRGEGAASNLAVYSTTMRYVNLKGGRLAGYGTTIEYSDLNPADMDLSNNVMSYSAVFGSNNYFNFYGTINNSYIAAGISNLGGSYYLNNSYLATSASSTLYASNSYVKYASLNNDSSVQSSVMGHVNGTGLVRDSDVQLSYGTTSPVFFSGSYMTNASGVVYTGYGSPEDRVGNGIADTKFKFNGDYDYYEYTVDGIDNPRSTPNFPDFVADPSVASAFWEPANVGCRWNKNAPDTFPDDLP